MEFHHQKTSSREIFSFPSTPRSPQDQDSDFEFGSLTPDYSPFKNSPADRLFSNGRLLPHSFPLQHQQFSSFTATNIDPNTNIPRTTSRTSSISSKDSFMSSRSNSVSSSRSSVSCSSARTSSSDNTERKLLYHTRKFGSCRSSSSTNSPMASKVVMAQLYGSSQRWQHIMPVLPLKSEDSKRRNDNFGHKGSKKESDEEKNNNNKSSKSGFCLRFFKSILVACRECHSMEPTYNDDFLQEGTKI